MSISSLINGTPRDSSFRTIDSFFEVTAAAKQYVNSRASVPCCTRCSKICQTDSSPVSHFSSASAIRLSACRSFDNVPCGQSLMGVKTGKSSSMMMMLLLFTYTFGIKVLAASTQSPPMDKNRLVGRRRRQAGVFDTPIRTRSKSPLGARRNSGGDLRLGSTTIYSQSTRLCCNRLYRHRRNRAPDVVLLIVQIINSEDDSW